MKNLFLDLDDTFVDTEKYIRRVLMHELLPLTDSPKNHNSVYAKRLLEGYAEIMEEIFLNYDVIPLVSGAEDCLNILSSEYNVIFCSYYVTKVEKESKEKFAEMYKKDIVLCSDGDYGKTSVDMSGGIVIDDSLDVLKNCNADLKIQINNPYISKGMSFKDYLLGDYFAENLPSAVDYLLGGNDSGIKSEKFRGFIYKGIQGECKEARR